MDGDLRTSPLPSAEIDAAGRVYVAWEDCRFRQHCSSNDIVFSTSTDGVTWSDTARIPIDPVTSTRRPFHSWSGRRSRRPSGSSAHLALTYYFIPPRRAAALAGSRPATSPRPTAGRTGGTATQLAGPMALSQIALTSQGPMVGDYISTSFSGGLATTLLAVGLQQPTSTTFDEAMLRANVAGSRWQPRRRPLSRQPPRASSVPVTGVGSGATRQALRQE